jgi:peptide/nickel transport system permease protein
MTDGRAGAALIDVWTERERSQTFRVPRALWRFCRTKPLGAVGGLLVLVLITCALFGSNLNVGPLHVHSLAPYGYNYYRLGRHKLEGPSWAHLMGTDELGRDVFSRLLYGARLSLLIGMGVVLISTTISTAISLVSGFYISSVDLLLQRAVEIVSLLPDLVIIVSLFSIYGATPLTLVVTVGVLQGFHGSRVLRSLVISTRGNAFVDAARAVGASDVRIMLRHILPNVLFWVIISATGAVAAAIALEAGLAILGFGVQPGVPTWGNMINASRQNLRTAPHLAIFPALMLALTIFGFRLLGDALRDVLDPRLRGTALRR